MLFDLAKYKDRIAVECADEKISYERLFSISSEISEKIGKRTLVFSLCTNSLGSLAGYLGFLNARIVPVMLDAKVNSELLDGLRSTYKPEYVWMPEKMRDKIPEGYDEVFNAYGYILIKGESCPYSLNDELAVLITTSGSTGSPKLVRQTYKNIESNTRSIIEYLKITEDEIAITSLPMNYVYGLSVINTHLYSGAKLVQTDLNCYTPAFWKLFNESKCTSFAGVPFMYEMMNKLNITKSIELPTLHTMTQAGGKLTPELQEKFSLWAKETGRRFIVMYGASEATARMGYLPSEMATAKKGSMGIAIPGGRFELIDADGKEIKDADTEGELVYYGENVTLGYSECGDDLGKGDENNGRLATGDIAKRDADGYYYIVGRKKRFVKMLGKRVNLDELERVLKEKFKTIDIACAGADDKLRVFLVDEALTEDVTSYVFDAIGVSRGLFKVIVTDKIPKNTSGKVLYSELNKMI